VADAWAHVCALADPAAALPYDEPEVQQARRDALAWWIPLLGDDLVCLTTLASMLCATGAPSPWPVRRSPFAKPVRVALAGTVVRTSLFSVVPAPPGPPIERYSGAAWPGGRFA